MIDMHTHILPHIDDGAKDSTMSAFMLKKEAEQGVKTVVFTSHYYGRKHGPSRFLDNTISLSALSNERKIKFTPFR